MSVSPALNKKFCVQKLKILADETRLSVLELLMECPKHVGELNQVLQIEQSLLSHHLKVLRQEGFVTAVRDGKAVLYNLTDTVYPSSGLKRLNLGCCILSFEKVCTSPSVIEFQSNF
jgi:DNA-binding transcriptional ArsR family regulator